MLGMPASATLGAGHACFCNHCGSPKFVRWQKTAYACVQARSQPVKVVAGGGYLANVAPSEFAQLYEEALPVTLTGSEFSAAYRRHWDAATQARCLLTRRQIRESGW